MKASDWQSAFTEAIFSGLSEPLTTTFSAKEQRLEQRFAIYQNNVLYSLTQALADLYPVIKQLVGEDFFNATAGVFIRKYPPTQAAMVHFGGDFPNFLSTFEHTQNMPYLADVAQLELKRHQAYHAADLSALSIENFEKVDQQKLQNFTVSLHPSFSLITSKYPIFSIWQSNHNNANEGNINIDEPESVIIVRHNYDRQVFNIDEGTHCFYTGLANNQTIGAAAVLAIDNFDCDISAAIALGIQNGFFIELHQ
jgi:hypothetical protein